MKNWWVITLGVVMGLLGAGIIFLASQPPRGNPIALLPPPTPIPIQVHLSGAVANPGVYALPPGSRVQEAIEAAGGLTLQADPSSLNLAAPLEDGVRIQIPAQTPTATPRPAGAATPSKPQDSANPTPATATATLININTASQTELETLSGIGPVTAQKIIAFREENGPFTSIEEIQKVSGIGPATFDKIKDSITVDEQP